MAFMRPIIILKIDVIDLNARIHAHHIPGFPRRDWRGRDHHPCPHQNQAIAAINRDLTRAQEITKDESSGVEFYASDSAVREIASGLSMIRAGMEALGQQAEQALARLPATVRQLVDDSATRIDAYDRTLHGAADAMVDDLVARGEIPKDKREAVRKVARRTMANPDDPAIAACGQHGFNLRELVASLLMQARAP